MAIGKYLSLERNFTPNVPPEAYSNTDGAVYAWVQNREPVERVATSATDTFDDVARAYREMSMPDDLLDLSPAGYRLAGGRAETLPDGRPITYTLYTSDNGAILSIAYPDAAMAAPVGAVSNCRISLSLSLKIFPRCCPTAVWSNWRGRKSAGRNKANSSGRINRVRSKTDRFW